jgi:succinylglutamate desuccinylase
MLTVRTSLPAGFLDVDIRDLHRLLPGPTLIHLPGRRSPPLFASILLHGNEDTSFRAMQKVLASFASRELPRALSLFVGNVAAAARNERFLAGQADYNRVWPGAESSGTPEHAMAREVMEQMRSRGVFASLDVHNNTGLNPHYACVNQLDRRAMQLASLFSRIIVYATRPPGTQSAAFSTLCPAVTVECGKTGNTDNDAHAAQFIDAALHLDHVVDRAPDSGVALYHTVATVKVRPGVEFAFGDATAGVNFEPRLDHMNFRKLPAGTRFAHCTDHKVFPLVVQDEAGRDVTASYFEIAGNELRTRLSVTPSMLTVSATAVRQDCLCYLMEQVSMESAGT